MGSSNNDSLETGKADRLVWLLKCPTVVSQAWQHSHANNASDTSRPLAKVYLSVDPLRYDPLRPRDDPDSRQVFLYIPLSIYHETLILLLIRLWESNGKGCVGREIGWWRSGWNEGFRRPREGIGMKKLELWLFIDWRLKWGSSCLCRYWWMPLLGICLREVNVVVDS